MVCGKLYFHCLSLLGVVFGSLYASGYVEDSFRYQRDNAQFQMTMASKHNNVFIPIRMGQEPPGVMTSTRSYNISFSHGKREKRFIGLIIGAAVGIAGIIMSNNAAKKAAENWEKQMQFRLEDLCRQICVTQWQQWSMCTKQCGGGTRRRSRIKVMPGKCPTLKNFNCPHHLSETESCNQGCPNGGLATMSGCSCTPEWKGTCCHLKVTCRYPGRPKQGSVFGTWPARYGAMATFTCDDGYYLSGIEMAACGTGGTWYPLPIPPKCLAITCQAPVLQGGHISVLNSQEYYRYGEEVYFECEDGYVRKGPLSRRCIKDTGAKGRWTGFMPRCKAIKCGNPGQPIHGQMNGTSFGYKDKVSFSCAVGYQLLGSSEMTCMATGRWLGRIPECVQIRCDAPLVPKFGSIRMSRKSIFGSLVTFSCDPGYVLQGDAKLSCSADGSWNSTEPECKAAMCPDPGVPVRGSKDGSVYYYPSNVTYSCFNGYVLIGSDSISCQTNGQWSSSKPTCKACDVGTYMDDNEVPDQCQPCAANTITLTDASTSKRHCICKKGYKGPPGGPCVEITCENLYAPQNGTKSNCSNSMGGRCEFGCVDGYIIDKGSGIRNCQESGEWDGSQPHCSPCPGDTYRSNVRSCQPCPVHSHTLDIGSIKASCICDPGYHGPGGGPCVDINECSENGGNGPCEDICQNLDGTYTCDCSIPGYKLDSTAHNCIVEKQCRNLTKEDAPDNGGLVCHWYREENSQQCGVVCNPGHEFPSRTNNYETCGSVTGYVWSFQRNNIKASLPACIPEFFPGFTLEADTMYFAKNCSKLTQTDKIEIYKSFKERLDNNSVCMNRASRVCNIEDMGIVCGKRTKRDIGNGVLAEVTQMDITFNVRSLKMGDNPRDDCDRICTFLRIPNKNCNQVCIPAYKRYLRAAVLFAKRQLANLFQEHNQAKLDFSAGGKQYVSGARIRQGDVEVECEHGMRANDAADLCVPCEAGTWWKPSTKECEVCPAGTYQPFKQQLTCLECPKGSTSTKPGSYFCFICPVGRYGEQCREECSCVNGKCHPEDGSCICATGWEGSNCEMDTDGCKDVNCYPGVACIDILAPSMGFTCGPCPSGYHGDGVNCQKDEL